MQKSLLIAGMFMLPMLAFAEPTPSPKSTLTFQVISDEYVLDKSDVVSASVSNNSTGLSLELTPFAALKLSNITKQNIGKKMGLIFNNKVISVTVIQSEIGGKLEIACSKEQANEIVTALKN